MPGFFSETTDSDIKFWTQFSLLSTSTIGGAIIGYQSINENDDSLPIVFFTLAGASAGLITVYFMLQAITFYQSLEMTKMCIKNQETIAIQLYEINLIAQEHEPQLCAELFETITSLVDSVLKLQLNDHQTICASVTWARREAEVTHIAKILTEHTQELQMINNPDEIKATLLKLNNYWTRRSDVFHERYDAPESSICNNL